MSDGWGGSQRARRAMTQAKELERSAGSKVLESGDHPMGFILSNLLDRCDEAGPVPSSSFDFSLC